jgi:hypothetical protein
MPSEIDDHSITKDIDNQDSTHSLNRKSNASLKISDSASIQDFEQSKKLTDDKLKEMRQAEIEAAEREAFGKLELAKKIIAEEEKMKSEAIALEKRAAEELRDKRMYEQYQKLVEFEKSRLSKKGFETGPVFLKAQFMHSTENLMRSDELKSVDEKKIIAVESSADPELSNDFQGNDDHGSGAVVTIVDETNTLVESIQDGEVARSLVHKVSATILRNETIDDDSHEPPKGIRFN